jgi:D-sedoheptulose 7-phosphate isomerase
MKEKIIAAVNESIKVKESIVAGLVKDIEEAAKAIIWSLKGGGKVLVFGNGGSAADSQHFAAELVGRFKRERRPYGAIALSTDTSALTAIANDYGYEASFSRQVEALGQKGDVAFGISTSGNSKNVIAAIRKAREMGMKTVCLLGNDGGALKKQCDVAIAVPSKDTPRIQESHITIIHILCELIDEI